MKKLGVKGSKTNVRQCAGLKTSIRYRYMRVSCTSEQISSIFGGRTLVDLGMGANVALREITGFIGRSGWFNRTTSRSRQQGLPHTT